MNDPDRTAPGSDVVRDRASRLSARSCGSTGVSIWPRQRAEFLAMVSHELRAPLAAIKGSTTTVLLSSPAPPRAEIVQFMRIIDGRADHMRRLIANLLDAGSIKAGTLTVEPEPANAAALVDQARTTFVTGGARNPVLIDLPPDLPAVMADPERIVQVLGNLLANAARNSPPSAPIRIEGARRGAFVALSVSDEGRGIAPDQLPHLFRKKPGPAGGTGLGLAISKGLVEAAGRRHTDMASPAPQACSSRSWKSSHGRTRTDRDAHRGWIADGDPTFRTKGAGHSLREMANRGRSYRTDRPAVKAPRTPGTTPSPIPRARVRLLPVQRVRSFGRPPEHNGHDPSDVRGWIASGMARRNAQPVVERHRGRGERGDNGASANSRSGGRHEPPVRRTNAISLTPPGETRLATPTLVIDHYAEHLTYCCEVALLKAIVLPHVCEPLS